MSKLLYEEESFAIIGACIEVHKKLGTGFLEEVYYEVLEKEFVKRNIPFEKHKKLELSYKGISLKKQFIADFVCYSKIMIVIKSDSSIKDQYIQHTVNYIKATHFELGLLINFGEPSLTWKRLINTPIAM